jgi:2'-5' RNA ligase
VATTRTFIAATIGRSAAADLARVVHMLQSRDRQSVRWVAREHVHVTLAFLGDVPNSLLADVCRLAAEAAALTEPFSWRLAGLGAFPDLERPRVLWAGVDDPTGSMVQIHNALEERLPAVGYVPETRSFRPHATIGRVARGRRPPPELAEAIQSRRDWSAGDVQTSEIFVFASDLGPRGPIYSVVATCPLGGRG